jgi:hypothetical protein
MNAIKNRDLLVIISDIVGILTVFILILFVCVFCMCILYVWYNTQVHITNATRKFQFCKKDNNIDCIEAYKFAFYLVGAQRRKAFSNIYDFISTTSFFLSSFFF